MSQENAEIVRRLWEAWERGDLTAWLELMRKVARVDMFVHEREALEAAGLSV
jgi:ketosteroid isomerase-like protein